MELQIHDELFESRFRDRVVSDVALNRGRRLVENFTGYLESVLYEADLRERHRVLSFEEYEPHRRENGGVRICLALAEYVLGIDLPDAVLGNDIFNKMYWTAVDAVDYANVSRNTPIRMGVDY